MNKLMKALIIQTAFIGDVILTLPLVECIKNVPEIESVDYLAIPDAYNILETNPNIGKTIIYDKRGKDKGLINLFRIIGKIKREKYHIAYIPHRSLRSAIVPLLAGIKKRVGFNNSAASFLLTEKIRYDKNIHEIERNLSLLSLNSKLCVKKQPKIYFDKSDIEKVNQFFQTNKISADEKLVGIAPGSRWATKRWLKERFAELIKSLKERKNVKSIIFGSKRDYEVCEQINSLSEFTGINTAGIFTPRQASSAMGKTNVVVTNDSGSTHLAVAGNAKVITIYGATIPGFGFYPYGNGHIIIEKKIECRPCGIHGGEKCSLEHFKCMKNITTEEVYEQVCKFI